jgi:hypothetical protein
MGCPQSIPVRPETGRPEPGRPGHKADAPDAAAPNNNANQSSTTSDRDFEADRARLARARKKRLAVAVETLATDADIVVVPKDEATVKLIARAVRDNPLFDGMPDETRAVLISSMTRVVVNAGADIITQGDDDATKFFVMESGAAVVRVKPNPAENDGTYCISQIPTLFAHTRLKLSFIYLRSGRYFRENGDRVGRGCSRRRRRERPRSLLRTGGAHHTRWRRVWRARASLQLSKSGDGPGDVRLVVMGARSGRFYFSQKGV